MEWQPIESAPEWQLVLVYQAEAGARKSGDGKVFCAVKVKNDWCLSGMFGRKVRRGGDDILSPTPTHWMPLPSPPKELP